jgi:hypothetical protein
MWRLVNEPSPLNVILEPLSTQPVTLRADRRTAGLEGVARRRRRTPLASQTSPYLAPRFYWDYW